MAISSSSTRPVAFLLVLSLSAPGLLAQTAVKLPKNRYTPQQDVQLGREAAAEVRKQYPIIEDDAHHAVSRPGWAIGSWPRRRPSSSSRSTSIRSRR